VNRTKLSVGRDSGLIDALLETFFSWPCTVEIENRSVATHPYNTNLSKEVHRVSPKQPEHESRLCRTGQSLLRSQCDSHDLAHSPSWSAIAVVQEGSRLAAWQAGGRVPFHANSNIETSESGVGPLDRARCQANHRCQIAPVDRVDEQLADRYSSTDIYSSSR